MTRLILASQSASRRAILQGAQIPFTAMSPAVDEAALKDELLANGLTPAQLALALARAKAHSIDAPADCLVLGGDQVLEWNGAAYDKPQSMAEAADRLLALGGQTHYLRSGLCLVAKGTEVFAASGSAAMTMRPLRRAEVEDYLAAVGAGVLTTVGAYALEGPGARLFDRIDGDYFGILGLDLLTLLPVLRAHGVVPW